jgi:predicted transposase YdaD
MQTDTLFHEYFKLVPHALFELLGITPPCAYRYESPVIKRSERRFDGFLEPEDPACPYYFVEIQGYRDRQIYWRLLSEVAGYHESRADLDGINWQAVLLFLDESQDPGPVTLGPLESGHERWLIRAFLPKLLHQPAHSPILNVLRPLGATPDEIRSQGAGWARELNTFTEIEDEQRVRLADLLVKFVMQRFVESSYKEIETMLNLTPLKETRAAKELMEEGRQEGQREGQREGQMIGQRNAIGTFLRIRFPESTLRVYDEVMNDLKRVKDEKVLGELTALAARVDSLSQFAQELTEILYELTPPSERE